MRKTNKSLLTDLHCSNNLLSCFLINKNRNIEKYRDFIMGKNVHRYATIYSVERNSDFIIGHSKSDFLTETQFSSFASKSNVFNCQFFICRLEKTNIFIKQPILNCSTAAHSSSFETFDIF